MTKADGAAPRALAARVVHAVLDQGRSLDTAFEALPQSLSAADRSLAQAMAYGVLRDARRLRAVLAPRLKRRPQPLLEALLLVGVFQLEAMRVPAHAAVHATVAATRELKLSRARGLVNAVLRGHQRDGAPDLADAQLGVRLSHPDWLVEAIRADWGERAVAVLEANNRPAPMHLRVNARRGRRDGYLDELARAGIEAEATAFCAHGVTLAEARATDTLPGFEASRVSVQDGAAQLAADLLDAGNGQRVLDACAAPGNKSAHLLERADVDLTALEIDAVRADTMRATFERLGLQADVRVGDAKAVDGWWDARAFDRILLDAPCTGTGVIRRHPDIKWLRRPDDVAAAAGRQPALLRALWATLAPGGVLLYATCSILRAEGSDVIAAFLAECGDAREGPIEADWGEAETHGRRLAPGQHGFDGFYYARLIKTGG